MPNDLSAYMPQDRRAALAAGIELPERTVGAGLFADISGFTPLAEALAQQLGPQRSVEELIHQLNRVFDALIAAVDAHGGSVIGFAGDAMVCWFDGGSAAGSAVACAFGLQDAMRPFAPGGAAPGQPGLTLSVGVAAGPARRVLVGDPRLQRFDVIAGRTLDRTVVAERLAGHGEVVVDAQLAAQLGGAAQVAAWREDPAAGARYAVLARGAPPEARPAGAARPGGATGVSQAAAGWLSPAIAAALTARGDRFLAELRPAAALMLQFSGIDYDADAAAGAKLDAYIRWVQRVVTSYHGAVIDLTMGDRESYLYAAFGAPLAHDDDAARAVAAALELRRPPPELAFVGTTRIGVAYGQMRAGTIGGAARRAYGVMGNAANLAFRLMHLAPPGEVYCDAAIHRLAGARWSFAALPPARVKGKAGLVRIYRPGAWPADERSGPRREPGALVGRDAEVARLGTLLDAVLAGETRVVAICGDAGIGKSRLLGSLVRLARERGVSGLLGAGQSIEQQTPYRAWRDVFAAYFDLDAAEDQAERRRRVQESFVELLPDQAQRIGLLNDLLGLDLPESDLTRTLDPGLRAASLGDLLTRLLRAWAAEQPLILVLEDAHWLDSRSWELASQVGHALSAEGLPLMLVLSLRELGPGHPAAQGFAALMALPGASEVALGPMPAAALTELVASQLGVAPEDVPAAVSGLVGERAGGNPFFASEIVAALREQGLVSVERRGGRPVVVGDPRRATAVLPETIQGLLLARIDRLPPAEQLTLRMAAVIGPTFGYRPLHYTRARHAEDDEAALRRQLHTLSSHTFTELEAPDPDLTYSFRHILTQEAAYQTLLYAQRRALHRTVAEWYETTFGGGDRPGESGLAPHLPLLAHHYRRAEDRARERHYTFLAGLHAAEQYANAEAVAFFGQALALTAEDDTEQRYVITLAREQILDVIGERGAQLADIEALERLARGPERTARVALRRSHYLMITGDYGGAARAARRAVEVARGAEAPDLEAEGWLAEGQALARHGAHADAERCLERARAIAHAGERRGVEAGVWRALSLIGWYRSDYPRAVICAERCVALYRALGDRRGEAEALSYLGNIARELSDYPRAEATYRAVVVLCEQTGDRASGAWGLYQLGTVASARGQQDAARGFYERSLAAFRKLRLREGEAWACNNLAKMDFSHGRYAAAWGRYAEALAIFRALGQRGSEGNALNGLGNVALARGDYAAARQCYEEALALAVAAASRREEADILVNLGNLAVEMGDLETAQARYAESVAISRAIEKPFTECYALDGLGQVAAARGRREEARALHEACLAIARRITHRNCEAWALVHLAAVAPSGARARALCRAGVGLFRSIGNRRGQAHALHALGDAQRRRGRRRAAARAYAAALGIRRDLGQRHLAAPTRAALAGCVASRPSRPRRGR